MNLKWLADENFPFASYKLLKNEEWNIKHISEENASISDDQVIQMANTEQRIILTLDSDFGTLIFKNGNKSIGVIYFRLPQFNPNYPAQILLNLIKSGFHNFLFHFTVISEDGIRQRTLPQ
ncbi:MAG TPA: hypothetical protein DCR35_07775 [Runella sp.]|nr:hypothetical protein [Runella sp.]